MRVSDNTNYGVVRDSVGRSRARMEDLQMKTATLKRVNKPSDDPVGSAKVLEVRTDKMNNEQFLGNAKLAESFLNNTDHALSDLSDLVIRAKEIAINQSSAASSTPEARRGVAEEVKQLYQQAVTTMNRRIGDRFIFGGFKTESAPFDAEGRYLGDAGEMMQEIGREVFIGMNLPGHSVVNTAPENSSDYLRMYPPKDEDRADRRLASEGENSSNMNLFQELKALRTGLLTGDLHVIRGTLESFDSLLGNVSAARAKIGSRINGIQGTLSALERHNITNAQLTSSIEDADMTQVVSDLAKEETVFKSSLAATKHLVQPTLLDFIR